MRFSTSRYLVVACHKFSHFKPRVLLLDFTQNCCSLLKVKFPSNTGQFRWVTRASRYHVFITKLLKQNLMSEVVELFRIPRTMLKILYFIEEYQFFQTSLGINFFLIGRENLFIHRLGRRDLGQRRHFKQICKLGKPPGHIPPEHLNEVLLHFNYFSQLKMLFIIKLLSELKINY